MKSGENNIQFRAWDKTKKEFGAALISSDGNIYSQETPTAPENDRFVIQRRGEIKDKNGNYVHEGDRIRRRKEDFFDSGKFTEEILDVTYDDGVFIARGFDIVYLGKFEIVSNIFEERT